MASSMLDAITGLISPSLISQFASAQGESESAVRKGFAAAVPAAMAALMSRASDPKMMRDIFAVAQDPANDSSMLSDPSRLISQLTGGARTGPIERMQSLLVGSGPGALAKAIANHAGINLTSAMSMLSMVIPMIFAYLGRTIRQDHLDSSGLSRRLMGERDAVMGSLPGWLSGVLTSGIGTVGDLAGTAASAASSAAGAATAASQGSMWRWVAAGIVAAAAVWALVAVLNRNGIGDQARAGIAGATGTAGYLTRSLPGGVDLRIPANGTEARLLTFIENNTPVDRNVWFEFDNINFETDSARLTVESRSQLDRVASILKAYPTVHVKIGGYTDNSGDPAANHKLSQDRAVSVSNALQGMGIPSTRLEAEGYGDQNPVADNSTPDGRARNRRVALRVTQR